MKKRRISSIVGATLLIGLLCMTGFAQDRRSAPSRADLLQKIRKELVTLPWYGVFDNLAFRLDGSTVTLYGQVVKPTTRSDAERRVERLNGVSRVINQIRVLPLSSFDDDIRRRTYAEISRKGSLYRYFLGANPSIHIIVDRGHVTLEGVVANRADANLAYIAARSVPGVFSVKNNLRTDQRAY
ncbi:MAG TPA: BON domain-containing protein [Pyrinomonadaceae bacterium]|nr:BON domain-containing protein [Pyrinomonadaceae bacterium]